MQKTFSIDSEELIKLLKEAVKEAIEGEYDKSSTTIEMKHNLEDTIFPTIEINSLPLEDIKNKEPFIFTHLPAYVYSKLKNKKLVSNCAYSSDVEVIIDGEKVKTSMFSKNMTMLFLDKMISYTKDLKLFDSAYGLTIEPCSDQTKYEILITSPSLEEE